MKRVVDVLPLVPATCTHSKARSGSPSSASMSSTVSSNGSIPKRSAPRTMPSASSYEISGTSNGSLYIDRPFS